MRVLALLSLASLSSAHFLLNYPKSIGFDDDKEDQAPCGGFTPDLSDASKLVDFHIGGDSIAVTLTHPQGNWLFRVTTDPTAQSGWEQISPIIQQSGLGNFCAQRVTVPQKYAGKKGVLSVVSSAPDGLLYQCVAANFVTGSIAPPSACKNASITASFTSDPKLSALVSGSGGSNSDGSSSSATTSSGSSATKTSAAATTSTSNAASSLQGSWTVTGISLGNAIAVLSMALLGGALMV